LSSLVVGREAPAVSLASLGDDKAVVSGSCDEFAINVRKDCRLHKESRFLVLVEEQIILVELGYFNATLGVVDPAPDEDLTRLGDGESMVAAANDLLDIEIAEALNNSGSLYRIVLIILILGNASLTESIESPGIDLSRLVDSKAVVVAAANLCNILPLESKLTRDKSAHGGSRDDTTSKLVLLAGSPREDLALVVESQDVIGSSREGGDILQLRNKNRGALSRDTLLEAQNAIIALCVLRLVVDVGGSRNLLETCPSRRPGQCR
jgi:hypothetical protein